MIDDAIKQSLRRMVDKYGSEEAVELIKLSMLNPEQKEEAILFVTPAIDGALIENGELDDIESF